MAQRKKEDIREAILKSAFNLFKEKGYNQTSLPQIARGAGTSTANIYVYFESKLDVLFTLYEPWLNDRLNELEKNLTGIVEKRLRLQTVILFLWRDLPRESNGFANNVMQAISNSAGENNYSAALRESFQSRIAFCLTDSVGGSKANAIMLAGALLMAFDGFAMNVRLKDGISCDLKMAQTFATKLATQIHN